jgi:hypothetical protein
MVVLAMDYNKKIKEITPGEVELLLVKIMPTNLETTLWKAMIIP